MEPTETTDPESPPSSREDVWRRLETLITRASAGGLTKLSDREVEEIGKLYRAAATHLALVRARPHHRQVQVAGEHRIGRIERGTQSSDADKYRRLPDDYKCNRYQC